MGYKVAITLEGGFSVVPAGLLGSPSTLIQAASWHLIGGTLLTVSPMTKIGINDANGVLFQMGMCMCPMPRETPLFCRLFRQFSLDPLGGAFVTQQGLGTRLRWQDIKRCMRITKSETCIPRDLPNVH